MMAHKICFSEKIWIIIPKLSLLLLLICPGSSMTTKSLVLKIRCFLFFQQIWTKNLLGPYFYIMQIVKFHKKIVSMMNIK